MEVDEHDELSELLSSDDDNLTSNYSDGRSEEFEMRSQSATSEESGQDDLPPDLVSTSEDETTDECGGEEEDADSEETDFNYK